MAITTRSESTLRKSMSLSGSLHLRSDLHLTRKLWHMGMGLMIAMLYWNGMARGTAVVLLSCFLGLDLLIETARLNSPAVNAQVMKFWGPLMRTNEANRLSGTPFYLASAVLAVGIFPREVAVLSILCLAFGDPMSSVFGILFGKHGPRFKSGKSLIGTSAGVITCALVSLVFLAFAGISGAPLALLALVGGFAGGTAELLPLEVDDNFSIPVVTGFALWLAFILVGI
jgi:diacylglycerol kinase (CTP)